MLRLYEREGLLSPPQRSATGYRHYAQDSVDRVRAIRLLKDLGLSLREIGLLLADSDTAPLDAAQMQALAAAQVQQIDARMARLALLRSYLAPLAAGDFTLVSADADCRFLVDFLAAAPATLEARP
jgi:DNA-binding transcriptional MerR regulator